jgi:hypothetical protein
MLFLLNENAEPKPPFLHKAIWMVASLAKKDKKTYSAFESFSYYKKSFNNYTGQLKWESANEEYTYNRYDYQSRKEVPVKDRRKILRVSKVYAERKESALKKIFSGLLNTAKDDPPMVSDYLTFKTQYLSVEQNDIKRIMLLVPNNLEAVLADIINQCMQYPTFSEETSKKTVIAALQVLHEISDNYGEMVHLFIGTCMISSDKTVANIAGEIWINSVTSNKISNEKLGEVIGLHESIEFAPLKRFTDLVTQQLFRISDKHNQALQIVIENILKQLPAKPITNLKKLLEIYAELLAINNSSITDITIISKLEDWKIYGSLNKISNALIENCQK